MNCVPPVHSIRQNKLNDTGGSQLVATACRVWTRWWMKWRECQLQIHSPCPRASARSVLTGWRPTRSHRSATLPHLGAMLRGRRGYFARRASLPFYSTDLLPIAREDRAPARPIHRTVTEAWLKCRDDTFFNHFLCPAKPVSVYSVVKNCGDGWETVVAWYGHIGPAREVPAPPRRVAFWRVFTTEITETSFGRHGRMPGKRAFRTIQTRFHDVFLDLVETSRRIVPKRSHTFFLNV